MNPKPLIDFAKPATLELWIACQRGNFDTVQHLLAQERKCSFLHLNLNWENEQFSGTIMGVAASQGHVDIVLALLRAGASPYGHVIVPPTQQARRTAALEKSGYGVSNAAQLRRRCSALLSNALCPPERPVCWINYADPTTVLCKSTHKLYFVLGTCEYQMKQSTAGSILETPSLGRRGQQFIGPQEEKHFTGLLGGMHPLLSYQFRVRYHCNNNGGWYTAWSAYSEFSEIPDKTLLNELEYVDLTAGTNYNFKQHLDEFCRAGMRSAKDLIACAQKDNVLNQKLHRVNTKLEYSDQRVLIRILRAKYQNVEYVDYQYKYKYGKEPVVDEFGFGTPMYRFLEGLKLEIYTEFMFRLVDSLDQLLHCYRSKEEFLEDIRESAPAMKPAHRRIIWLAIQQATSSNASTNTSTNTSTKGEEKSSRK